MESSQFFHSWVPAQSRIITTFPLLSLHAAIELSALILCISLQCCCTSSMLSVCKAFLGYKDVDLFSLLNCNGFHQTDFNRGKGLTPNLYSFK